MYKLVKIRKIKIKFSAVTILILLKFIFLQIPYFYKKNFTSIGSIKLDTRNLPLPTPTPLVKINFTRIQIVQNFKLYKKFW